MITDVHDRLADLRDEISVRNHVEVAVFRAVRGEVGIRHRRVERERYAVVALDPALALADRARMLAGRKPVYLAEAYRRRGGELVDVAPNLRTNLGADFLAAALSGAGVTVADWIALSATATSPAATMGASTLPWSTAQTTDGTTGEFTTYGGMGRKQATYAHTATGPATLTNTYSLAATWTASATVTNLRLAGLFGGTGKATQGGTDAANVLVATSAFTAATLAATDQLAITWTITI